MVGLLGLGLIAGAGRIRPRGLREQEGPGMTLADQLSDLAAKAKQVQDRVAAAKQKTKADLEADVDNARASAQAQADALHTKAEASKGKISAWWDHMERSWHEH